MRKLNHSNTLIVQFLITQHNVNFCYRDAGVIAIGHFVWSILAVLFVFSLIGVAHSSQTINIENIKDSDMATGKFDFSQR